MVVGSTDGGRTWRTQILDTSQEAPPCSFKGCYRDFFSSQATIAADSSGTLYFEGSADNPLPVPPFLGFFFAMFGNAPIFTWLLLVMFWMGEGLLANRTVA